MTLRQLFSPAITAVGFLRLTCHDRTNVFYLCRRATNYFLRRGVLHTSAIHHGLEEFFDEPDNWGEKEVKVGRGWRVGELRIKSNEDLHKLWYVLLKELNMLYTMEYACKDEHQVFPNPERIDKVKDSMANIETVVRERNKAYMLLETGETGERPGGKVRDIFGRYQYYDFQECHVPPELNPVWQKYHYEPASALEDLNKLLQEKLRNEEKLKLNEKRRYVERLLAKFPTLDMEELQLRFPELDVESIRRTKEARAHHDQNED